jgi:hypothetical protein
VIHGAPGELVHDPGDRRRRPAFCISVLPAMADSIRIGQGAAIVPAQGAVAMQALTSLIGCRRATGAGDHQAQFASAGRCDQPPTTA